MITAVYLPFLVNLVILKVALPLELVSATYVLPLTFKNRDVQELFDLSSQGSYSYIQKLLEKGLIKSQGKGRSTVYVLK